MKHELEVAQWVPRTAAEGPGERFAIWVQGCPLRCPGCCNPELLPFRGGRCVPVAELYQAITNTPGIEGISLLGGEPFAQAEPLAELCSMLKQHTELSIMIFSGFTLDELRAKRQPAVARLLATCDLLVDGRYQAENPDRERRWIGSSNQRLHCLSHRYSPRDPRFFEPNTVEIRWRAGELLVNGWPEGSDALLQHGTPSPRSRA